jgi:hypothetical protein
MNCVERCDSAASGSTLGPIYHPKRAKCQVARPLSTSIPGAPVWWLWCEVKKGRRQEERGGKKDDIAVG